MSLNQNAQYRCRSCGIPLRRSFLDLGHTPLANAMLRYAALNEPETHYPLHAFVCEECLLVQLPQFNTPEEIFSDYVYFSSFSNSWLEHARRYATAMVRRFSLGSGSVVVEIASNDGYLLKNFVGMGMRVLGVEPAANVADVAVKAGIPTHAGFFGQATAEVLLDEGYAADLMTANNVVAHVPDLNDFLAGCCLLLKPEGVLTFEFPHLLNLLQQVQFDTIYHEHFSYYSLLSFRYALDSHELRVFDVEELPTHGGSLRVYVCHTNASHEDSARVEGLFEKERTAGLDDTSTYEGFAEQARRIKLDLLAFLVSARNEGKLVATYGAAAKGNTLLNYCGVDRDLIIYGVDRNPHKQGLFMPGSHIPVYSPERIVQDQPDYVLILPWNLRDEIADQMAIIREWGGRFVVPVPALDVF